MRRSIIAGAAMVALLLLGPTSGYAGEVTAPPLRAPGPAAPWGLWVIGGCALDIFAAAAVAHWTYNRELTPQEAFSCGLLFWLQGPAAAKPH